MSLDAQTALVLALAGAVSTGAGGLVAVFGKKPRMQSMGVLQAFAAGVMIAISFFDLLPEASEEVGFEQAALWFCGGVLLFAVIVYLVPDPDKKKPVAAVPTRAGTTATTSPRVTRSSSRKTRSRTPSSRSASPQRASSTVVSTAVTKSAADRAEAFKSGVITALGITLHNFPEGMAVCLSAMSDIRFGIPVTVAIALHNIPEGMAVALPVYAATGSRKQAVLWAFVSGLAEPLGVVLVISFAGFFAQSWLIHSLLASVAGIMIFLSLGELLPYAFKHSKKRSVVIAVHAGMFIMLACLIALNRIMPHGHHDHSDHSHDHSGHSH